MKNQLIIFILLIFGSFNISAEELECQGGTPFQNRKFSFKDVIHSNESHYVSKSIPMSEGKDGGFFMTIRVENFLINSITLVDKKNKMMSVNTWSGLKEATLTTTFKRKGIFISCHIQ